MGVLAINDLPDCRLLDLKAIRAVRGGGAPWVFGWISPFVPETPSFMPVVNFYQINNFSADQMNNQIQMVNVSNSASNANVNVVVDAVAGNTKNL